MATAMTSEEILDRLEEEMSELEEFQGATFEVLEDYEALADARLSVFASERMWAIAIEAVRYGTKVDEFNLDIWLYGNCLKPRGDYSDLTRLLFTIPRSWNKWSGSDVWGYARDGFSILWRGHRLDFSPSAAELETAQIKLSRREQKSVVLTPVQVLRFLCHHLDHPFFASEDTLRDLLNARTFKREWRYEGEGEDKLAYVETELGRFEEFPILSCDLELVLQTREWCHPRFGGMPEEEISVREAFAPLAEALATGDFSIWHNQDPKRFNSHWTYWAETEHAAEESWEQYQLELAEECRRFREWITARLTPAEQEELLQNLRESWQEAQRELQVLSSQLPTGSMFTGISYDSSSSIVVAGQTFTFGPHLWGEMDAGEYIYPDAAGHIISRDIPESTPSSPPELD